MASNRDPILPGGTTNAPAGTTGSAGIPPASGGTGEYGSAPNSGTSAGLGRTEETKTFLKSTPETGTYGAPAGEANFTPSDAHGSNTGASIGKGIRGVFAQGHGIGETIRGNFNAALDGLAGSKEGEEKNAAIANKGEREFTNKEFEHGSTGRHL